MMTFEMTFDVRSAETNLYMISEMVRYAVLET